jgi:beta-glucosidase
LDFSCVEMARQACGGAASLPRTLTSRRSARLPRALAAALIIVGTWSTAAAEGGAPALLAVPIPHGSPWPPECSARAAALLAQMSTQEKLAMVHGYGNGEWWLGNYAGLVLGNTRIGWPPLNLEDGPQGVADGVSQVTCWPSSLTVTSTWNVTAMAAFGAAMGEEQFAKGANIMLGPGVNLARVPWGGRNFEYLGEDPLLASRLVAAEIAGIQSANVSACVKHLLGNNQEMNRGGVDVHMPRRAYMEAYIQPFLAAVDAGCGAAMCAYNLLNGTYACENAALLGDVKERFGFRGFVMSDWFATHSTITAAAAGLDMEMPGDTHFGLALAQSVANGSVPEARLDDMLMRALTPLFAVGVMDNAPTPSRNLTANAITEAHSALAVELACASIVLLKNDHGLLPLSANGTTSVLVLGDVDTVHGTGSGGVTPAHVVSPYEGIYTLLNGGPPPRDNIAAATGGGVNVTEYSGQNASLAASLAADFGVVVMSLATSSGEGADRLNLSLPLWQDEMAAAVLAANPRAVIVARCPGACAMPWAAAARAVLLQLMPGQASGTAIAQTIFGANNPSGKLTVSFPASMNGTWLSTPPGGPIDPALYPGSDRGGYNPVVDYAEGLGFGYRFFDAHPELPPLWAFGHGLSYSTFVYSNLAVDGAVSLTENATVSMTLTNSAGPAGAEVVQLYVSPPAAVGGPPKMLKGFQKALLAPGEARTLMFSLSAADLAVFDVSADAFVLVPGSYGVLAAAAADDIRLSSEVDVG